MGSRQKWELVCSVEDRAEGVGLSQRLVIDLKHNSLAGLRSGPLDESMVGAGEREGRRGWAPGLGRCVLCSPRTGSVALRLQLLSEPSKQQEPLEALEVFFEKAVSPQI